MAPIKSNRSTETATPYKRKPVTVRCDLCLELMDSRNLGRHLKTCTREPLHDWYSLDAQFNGYEVDIKNPPYHVMVRTDAFAEGYTLDDFMQHWKVYNNIYAECADHRKVVEPLEQVDINMDTATHAVNHPHVHFIGYWLPGTKKKSDKLNKLFNDDKCFRALNLRGEKVNVKPWKTHLRLLKAIWYIQTVNGVHPKRGHKNPNTFSGKYNCNTHIKAISSENIWIQAQYYHYLKKLKSSMDFKREIPIKISDYQYDLCISKLEFIEKSTVGISEVQEVDIDNQYNDYLEHSLSCCDCKPGKACPIKY